MEKGYQDWRDNPTTVSYTHLDVYKRQPFSLRPLFEAYGGLEHVPDD